ncbi:MAG: TatD family hydrolase [Escherichia coli]
MICRFIDTHCHFYFPPFSGDEEASLQRAAQAGVGRSLFRRQRRKICPRAGVSGKYQPLYAALGLHPGC